MEGDLWCLDKVDQRGEWERGWAGFVSCEEAVKGDVLGWRGGKGEGKGNLEKYIACKFRSGSVIAVGRFS